MSTVSQESADSRESREPARAPVQQATDAPPAAAPSAAPPSRRGWALLRRLHFYAGVFVAPFLIVAALTGLAYAFSPQVDRIAYGDLLTAEQVTDDPVPLHEQVTAARQAYPGGTLFSVITPASAGETTQVVLAVPELGDRQRTVYVDPYTGEVEGALTTYFGATPATTWLDRLHGTLHLGDTGRLYSETAASWLWVLVVVGLVLWLGRARGQRARGVRGALLPPRAARGVRRTRGWHATTGVWLALILLGLSATGLTWSQYAGERFTALLDSANAQAPAVDTTLPGAAPEGGGGQGGHEGHAAPGEHGATGTDANRIGELPAVLAAARDAGLDGPVVLTPPTADGQAWTVAQSDNVWPVRLDTVAVDPGTGEVTDESRFADYPLLAKLSRLGIQAHMGVLFGLANQLVLAATAVGLLTVILLGYRMWWQRRPTRADRRAAFGRPPERGAWRQLPRPVLVLGVPVAVALGWALPVLGVTLLGFLLVDVLVGAAARHRARRAGDATAPFD